jgi:hypothetical protein
MNQSSRHSVYETLTNIVVGFAINFTLQLVVYPLLGIRIAGATNLLIVAIFTVASFLRGLALRRIFNASRGSAPSAPAARRAGSVCDGAGPSAAAAAARSAAA